MMFKNSISTSQRIVYFPIIKAKQLMLCRKLTLFTLKIMWKIQLPSTGKMHSFNVTTVPI
jgi:hypothetical protein